MPDRRWTVLDSKILLDRWWLRLREDRVRLPTGAVIDEFHVAEYPDWACVVAVTPDGRVPMVEQYRHAIGRLSLEFPAGVIGAGEDPEAAAQRELMEEVGYAAASWRLLGRVATEPSRHTNYGVIFAATGAHAAAAPSLDATEDLVTRLVPAAEVAAMAVDGRIVHGVHVAAALWAVREGVLPGG